MYVLHIHLIWEDTNNLKEVKHKTKIGKQPANSTYVKPKNKKWYDKIEKTQKTINQKAKQKHVYQEEYNGELVSCMYYTYISNNMK